MSIKQKLEIRNFAFLYVNNLRSINSYRFSLLHEGIKFYFSEKSKKSNILILIRLNKSPFIGSIINIHCYYCDSISNFFSRSQIILCWRHCLKMIRRKQLCTFLC